jgi:hypothetical protein
VIIFKQKRWQDYAKGAVLDEGEVLINFHFENEAASIRRAKPKNVIHLDMVC